MSALELPALAHYATKAERLADKCIHFLGVGSALIGGPILVGLAIAQGGAGRGGAALVYALCLVCMLGVSAAYNLALGAPWQRRLRRLDHAAIFLMIAGSYTPFTTQRFEGAWAIAMTIAVWTLALAAAAGKLFLADVSRRIWIPVYLVLGWLVVMAIDPMLHGVRPTALILLVIGGVIYSTGVIIYSTSKLPFRRAIWHGFVFTAACTHYAAILMGVVLA